jgi:hypothetical protein
VAGCCECGDEPSDSCTKELVICGCFVWNGKLSSFHNVNLESSESDICDSI